MDIEGPIARAWFRGQADAKWKLTPGVYRPGFINIDNEAARLKRSGIWSQDCLVRSGNLLTGPSNDVDLDFLQQHFGIPTRLRNGRAVRQGSIAESGV